MTIAARKNNHIDICLREDVRSHATNGFEKYRLVHNALPEADFDNYSVETVFLEKKISAPFLISSMTGGTEQGELINRNLIEAAAELDLPFAIGSQRIYLTDPDVKVFPYRKLAPDIPILANAGAVQMNYGFGRDDFLRAVDMIEADALILHLNPLQELIQRGGDTDFSGLLCKIESLCRDFPVPVVAKEVGWGISCDAAIKLRDAGISMIDVAGAGGTSWTRVESRIDGNAGMISLAAAFDDWGIPTAECLQSIHDMDASIPLIASGGITNGVEAAKAVRLGASIAGMAANLLPAAIEGANAVCDVLNRTVMQYKIAMFVSSGIEKCVG